MDFGHGWWILMIGAMAVGWAIVIFASVWVLHSLTREQDPHGATAVDRLDTRFARGEISAEEYRERRDALAIEPQI
jgi:uncharacterized membrane protein